MLYILGWQSYARLIIDRPIIYLDKVPSFVSIQINRRRLDSVDQLSSSNDKTRRCNHEKS